MEYVERELGFKTRAVENPVTTSVSTTATKIFNNNPDRFQWLLVNLGANDIYVAFKPDVSPTKGILVAAKGGYVSMHAREDGEAVTYEVWAITAVGTSAIYTVEYEKR